MKKIINKRRALLSLAVLLVVAGLLLWRYLTPYEPGQNAETAMLSAGGVTVEQNDGWISFEPAVASGTAVIFYPGALVEAEAYAPLAKRIATAGHPFYIAKMPFNLAVIKGDAAEEIISAHPQQSFVIGGHSLGGVMASRYAAEHADQLEGVFYLASYPDEKGSLKDTTLSVLSVLGTADTVVNKENYNEGRAYLPGNTVYFSIEGGNHAQFGSYGKQKGDGEASITEEEQQTRTARAMLDWLGNLR
ncbi:MULTISPECIES: alpha/beta hydrolase [unclassified Paenibacillus]|uniref:alpha/beta hydrolase n=1 Tax=unclassified Paenibacillus TaxID=185978 RepID=UPI0024058058|nr:MULTISPECIES: alpha/beta hydrolase [unclassified Paenibacillus]MDF9843868.1 dienelactone hydrolase [Paenibacillus sp. PastF-2]MDF9850448.1 dienelactone hydrolase [Paenibacillus sp. PastM-2]MDF9857047.1 dienelactone hydrolase [Paenibacillus sp. PastF-1]MDH6482319.1 dienelactone hydrolase [Paenibacillus sp. PastH-2]MDH6509714.1 dienelactone hydrolase [Paenibacillus sp. PastM-3]